MPRVGAVPRRSGHEQLGVGAVRDQLQPRGLEAAGLELALHAGVTAIRRARAALNESRQHLEPARHGSGLSSPTAIAACGQSSRQSTTSGAPARRAASHAVSPRKSGGIVAITTSGRGPESAVGKAESAKVRWFQSRVTGVFFGVAWSQTRSIVTSRRARWRDGCARTRAGSHPRDGSAAR